MKKLYKSFKSMMRGETTNSAAAEATTSQEADVARERSSAPSLSPQSELVIHKPIKSFGTASQPDREEVAMDTRADLGHLLSEPSAASVKDLEKETQGHALRSHSPAPSHTSLSKIGTDPSMILISSATCPQFAAKAISGLRSTMEDCFAIVPDIAAIPRHWLVDLKLHQGPTSAEGRPGSAASASSYISKNSTSELDSPSTSSTSHGPRQHPSPISFPPQAASSGAASNMNSSHIASAHDHPPSTSHSSHKISQPKVVSSELPPQLPGAGVSVRSSDTSTHTSSLSQQSTDLHPLIESVTSVEPPHPPTPIPEVSGKKVSDNVSEGTRSFSDKLTPLHMFAVYDGHGGAAVAQHISRRMHEHFRVALSPLIQADGSELHAPSEPSHAPPQAPLEPSHAPAQVGSEVGSKSAQSAFVLRAAEKERAKSAALPKSPTSTPESSASATLPTLSGNTSTAPTPESLGVDKVKAVLIDSFLSIDLELAEEVNDSGVKIAGNTGSTAVVAVVCDTHIWVANCGDSRAIMALKGGATCALSVDHKASRKDEVARVQAAGGMVWWDRVMGELAISRAIGDHRLRPYVIPNPEVECFTRTEADQLIILASDGLWDVMSNSDVANHALRKFQKYLAAGHSTQSSLRHVASSLAKTAISKGSRDNITVLVVDVRPKVRDSTSLIPKTSIDASKP